MQSDPLIDALRRSVLGASEEALAAALESLTLSVVKVGDKIMSEGEDGHSIYILVQGRAAVQVSDTAGKSHWLDDMLPGSLLGEIAVLAGVPRTATVIAREPCRVATLSGVDFRRIVVAHGDVGLALAEVLAARLSLVNRRVPEIAADRVAVRLLTRYRELAVSGTDPDWGTIDVPPTKTNLAMMISSRREVVSRAHKDLLEKNLIRPVCGRNSLLVHMSRTYPTDS